MSSMVEFNRAKGGGSGGEITVVHFKGAYLLLGGSCHDFQYFN